MRHTGFNRRQLLAAGAALAATGAAPAAAGPFVRVAGQQLRRGAARYPVIGTNLWYAGWLGARDPGRLTRELDRLRGLGVNNVRLLGAAERSPLHGTVSPVIRGPGPDYDQGLLAGLDRAMAEIAARGMTAVIYTNNFWEWSGGMAAYLTYVNGGHYVEAVDPSRPWTDFPDFVSGFYSDKRALALADDYLAKLVGRRNTVTRRPYAEDPAIMAWQLANEPRPAGTEAAYAKAYPHYLRWLRDTARLIKAHDPNHLVSAGTEGLKGCLDKEACVVATDAIPEIDYLTMHIWPQNFGWVRKGQLAETYDTGAANTRDYIAAHARIARQLNKPIVVEEFGFPREGGGFDAGDATTLKDRFYALVLGAVAEGYAAGGPLAGANFWAWNGEGRAQHPDHRFRPGDTAFLGDPPHEPQGFYGVFDTDRTTLTQIRSFAAAMRAA